MPGIEVRDKIVKFQFEEGIIKYGPGEVRYEILLATAGRLLVKVGDEVREITYSENADGVEISSIGGRARFRVLRDRDLLLRQFQSSKSGHGTQSEARAPMPGLVVKVLVNKGESVKRGSTLAILEAMKMENEIRASQDAVVGDVLVKDGDIVEKDQTIVILL